MSVFSVLKRVDRALHINKLRYYLMDKKYSFDQFWLIRELCNNADFIMLNTPDHGNLGDHAIALAEQKFFNDRLPQVAYREVSGDYFRKNYRLFKMVVKPKNVIGICGGGYIGDVWMDEEELVRNVIESFPANKIIIFPQTVYYHDDLNGHKEWEYTKQLMEAHGDSLYFCLRDRKSYDFIRENSNKIRNALYFPDMVLSLDVKFNQSRKGILTCFRTDQEKTLSDSLINKIYSYAKDNGIEITPTTTVYSRNIGASDREEEVNAKLKEFSSSRLVITDRLHAMIFAAITGTPCIAFDNESKKISGVYEWIKDLDYIRFISDSNSFDEIIKVISKMLKCKNTSFSINKDIWTLFEKEILSIIED